MTGVVQFHFHTAEAQGENVPHPLPSPVARSRGFSPGFIGSTQPSDY